MIFIDDPAIKNRLDNVLQTIVKNAQEIPKNAQQNNAQNAVLFEAINLAIHINPNSEICSQSANLLGEFISSKETNIRYLGLETMAHLAAFPESLESIKIHQKTVFLSLKDKDISVRRRALDLLYSMCDLKNAKTIVQELLDYLHSADFAIKEEVVLKIAILTEKFAPDYHWYVDTVLRLIAIAGDNVSEDIWYRIVQIVTNNENLQEYAAKTVMSSLRMPSCHETTMKVGGYILGEFGHLIANLPGCAPQDQFWSLHSKFTMCSIGTRALLLSTYLKFINLFPEIKPSILTVFDQYQIVLDTELQQRACEYKSLATMSNDDLLATVCEEMPPFPVRENALVAMLKKTVEDTADSRTWNIGGTEANLEGSGSSGNGNGNGKGKRKPVSPSRPVGVLNLGQDPKVGDQVVSTTSKAILPVSNPTKEIDLLGLDEPPMSISSSSPSTGKELKSESMTESTLDILFNRLILIPNGVLHEDSLLQIGVKTEYHNQLGRMAIFFGNKSPHILQSFTTEISYPDISSIQNPSNNPPTSPRPPPASSPHDVKITLIQPMSSTLSPVTQLNQMYNIECSSPISHPPNLKISFQVNNSTNFTQLSIPLPVLAHKFMSGVELTGIDFFEKWKLMGGPPREIQSIFKAGIPGMDSLWIQTSLSGCNLKVLKGVDPNERNWVGAGIFHSLAMGKIGTLVRLEPNYDLKVKKKLFFFREVERIFGFSFEKEELNSAWFILYFGGGWPIY